MTVITMKKVGTIKLVDDEKVGTVKELYFYKGTAFPTIYTIRQGNYEVFRKHAMEMIMLGLKHGVSREVQIVDYITQLDIIEGRLREFCNPSSVEGMKRMAKSLNTDEQELYSTWTLDILALMILGVLKDDNNNGVLITECDLKML